FGFFCFFFSSRRRHTRFSRDWSSDVCSSDLGKLNNTALHTKTDSKEWNIVFPCILHCYQLAFKTAMTKTRSYKNTLQSCQFLGNVVFLYVFTLYAYYINLVVVICGSMNQCFDN